MKRLLLAVLLTASCFAQTPAVNDPPASSVRAEVTQGKIHVVAHPGHAGVTGFKIQLIVYPAHSTFFDRRFLELTVSSPNANGDFEVSVDSDASFVQVTATEVGRSYSY